MRLVAKHARIGYLWRAVSGVRGMTRFRRWLLSDPLRGVVLSLAACVVSTANALYVFFGRAC